GYRVPNMPVNGKWHEWTFNYDLITENREMILNLSEYEGKIFVYLGDQPEESKKQQQ
ncbi:unnamed protein product, partial [Didymodactylos carnosus]